MLIIVRYSMMQHTLLCPKVVIVFMQLFIQGVLLSSFCTVPGYMMLLLVCYSAVLSSNEVKVTRCFT